MKKTDFLGLFMPAMGDLDWAPWLAANSEILDAAYRALNARLERMDSRIRLVESRLSELQVTLAPVEGDDA